MTNSTSKRTVQLSRFTKYGLAIASIAATASLGFAVLAQTPAPAAAPKSSSQSSTTATKKPATAGAATHAATYDRALLHPALLKDKAPDTYVVKFVTTRGDFTITVNRAWAPLGADRFYNLVKHHFYDNAVVFRAVPNFVTQFGISSYPAVSTAWKKTEIKDDPVTQSNKKGAIVFATAGPNTRTTQVFINLKDNAFLDKTGFAPFGTVDGAERGEAGLIKERVVFKIDEDLRRTGIRSCGGEDDRAFFVGLGDGIVLDLGLFPCGADGGIRADAELRDEIGNGAEDDGVVIEVVFDEIVEAVGSERRPGAVDGDGEVAARGDEFDDVSVGSFVFQQRGMEECAIVGGGVRCGACGGRLFRCGGAAL